MVRVGAQDSNVCHKTLNMLPLLPMVGGAMTIVSVETRSCEKRRMCVIEWESQRPTLPPIEQMNLAFHAWRVNEHQLTEFVVNIMAMAAAVPSDLYDRFLFNTREQVDGEPIHVFAQSLQNLVNNCHYMGATDSHLSSLVSVFVLYIVWNIF